MQAKDRSVFGSFQETLRNAPFRPLPVYANCRPHHPGQPEGFLRLPQSEPSYSERRPEKYRLHLRGLPD